jgi:hypothetical protein
MPRLTFDQYYSIKKFFVPAFFIVYLFIGLFLYKDYGISYDEQTQRIENGCANYHFILHKEPKRLLEGNEKYHGPAFEIVLFSLERIFNFDDVRSVYLFRHLVTFLFFFFSTICFYKLMRNASFSAIWALCGVIMLIFSPRIFAESFYNSKDIGFLSFFIISLLTLDNFIRKKNLLNCSIHALATAFMIDIRLTGIIIPGLTVVVFLIDTFQKKWKSGWMPVSLLLAYIILQFLFIIFFWPILWLNPFHHLIAAFHEIGHYPWNGNVLFNGSIYNAMDLPWFYLPFWMFLTIPVLFLLFFFVATGYIIKYLTVNTLKFFNQNRTVLLSFLIIFITLFSIIFFRSTVYDGWRHVYFVYVPFCIVATYGVKQIYTWLTIRGKNILTRVMLGTLLTAFGSTIAIMIKDHPYQNVYFNSIGKLFYKPLEKNFEMDYWGLSYRKALEDILATDTAKKISIGTENFAGELNLQILPKQDQERIIYVRLFKNPIGVKYFIPDVRDGKILNKRNDTEPRIKITNTSGTLLGIYQLLDSYKKDTLLNFNSIASTKSSYYNSENNSIHITIDSAFIKYPSQFYFSSEVKFQYKFPEVLFVAEVIRNQEYLYWFGFSLRGQVDNPSQMQYINYCSALPEDLNIGDKMNFHFWELNDRDRIIVNKMQLEWISFMPTSVIFQSSNKKFVSISNDGYLIANQANASNGEIFLISYLGSDRIMLKSSLGYKIQCNNDEKLTANSSNLSSTIFSLIKKSDGKTWSLKTDEAKFVSADRSKNDTLIANRNDGYEWETFSLEFK